MSIRRTVVLCLATVCLFFGNSSFAQSPALAVPRDTQAIAILTQALTVGGGLAGVSATQDVTATGSVTFRWAGNDEVGTVTIKGRGTRQLRLDATLSEGVLTWATSNGQGFRKDANGSVVLTLHHSPLDSENILFPMAQIAADLRSRSTGISYIALEQRNGAQVHHIRVSENYAQSMDPTGIAKKPATTDFFVDASSAQIRSVLTVAFANDYKSATCAREMQYADYHSVEGIFVPFSITELIGGQQTFSIQLTQASFNSGLTDRDFEP